MAMQGINELQGMRILDLAEKIRLSDEDFEQWLVGLGLLHGRQECERCGENMALEKYKDGQRWVCNKRACRGGTKYDGGTKKKKGYKVGTFFEGARLSCKSIFLLSYFWVHDLGTIAHQMFEVEIASEAAVQWHQYFRDVCAEYFVNHPQVIGGLGADVEIDETCLSKRKYQRGRLIRPNQWMFGGIERGTKRAFMVLVDQRNAATLLPIIQQYIAPGSTVYSDLWRAYGGIPALPQGYQHLTVNHSMNFVDPFTGAHTQNIENTWMRFKRKVKKSMGLNTTSEDRYSDYLQEFMWRQQFGERSQVLFNFWSQVAQLYPCLS